MAVDLVRSGRQVGCRIRRTGRQHPKHGKGSEKDDSGWLAGWLARGQQRRRREEGQAGCVERYLGLDSVVLSAVSRWLSVAVRLAVFFWLAGQLCLLLCAASRLFVFLDLLFSQPFCCLIIFPSYYLFLSFSFFFFHLRASSRPSVRASAWGAFSGSGFVVRFCVRVGLCSRVSSVCLVSFSGFVRGISRSRVFPVDPLFVLSLWSVPLFVVRLAEIGRAHV